MARQGRKKTAKAVKIKAAKKLEGVEAPTAELMSRFTYEYGPVKTELGIQIGAAYQRQPLYLTMQKRQPGRFNRDELAALTVYRSVFDRSERSPVASCLAAKWGGRGSGGSGDPAGFLHASPAILSAKRRLALLERHLGSTLSTMRDVVLQDQSFSAIAIERFGGRRRNWIEVTEQATLNGEPVKVNGEPRNRRYFREDVAPRSGKHRQIIAEEFNRGLKLLTMAVARTSGASIDEVWVQPESGGTATIYHGQVAPTRLFRMWGPSRLVEHVVDDLLARNGGQTTFATPAAAQAALTAAAEGRLQQLEPEELAA